jgi:hypothetical protein
MRTLKQFVIRYGKKNEAEAEEFTRTLMQWLRECRAESQYSLDEISRMLADDTPDLFQPADLESFFASDNPRIYDYLAVVSVLGESLLEVLGIIGGLPEDLFKLPAHLRKQIRRGWEIGGTDFIDDCEDGRSAELN